MLERVLDRLRLGHWDTVRNRPALRTEGPSEYKPYSCIPCGIPRARFPIKILYDYEAIL